MQAWLTTFVSTLVLSLSIANVSAQTLSPEMLEQLKAMPRAEQEALARQYGVDLNVLDRQEVAAEKSLAQPAQALPQAEKPVAQQLEERSGVKNPLKRFGVGLFDREVSTFAPTDNAQVPADYRLGVGDELVIQLFGKDNSVMTLQVGRDGIINFPKLGPVSVAGLTF